MRSNHIVGELGRSQSQFSISCLRKPHSQAVSCLRKSHSQVGSVWVIWGGGRPKKHCHILPALEGSTLDLFMRKRTHTAHTHVNRKRVQAPISSLIQTCKRKYTYYKVTNSIVAEPKTYSWTPSRSSSAGTPSTNKPGKKEDNQCMEAELKCKLILTFSFLIKSLPRRIS